jgi:hypothetical protein
MYVAVTLTVVVSVAVVAVNIAVAVAAAVTYSCIRDAHRYKRTPALEVILTCLPPGLAVA